MKSKEAQLTIEGGATHTRGHMELVCPEIHENGMEGGGATVKNVLSALFMVVPDIFIIQLP